ncbi:MAG: TonB-dependent receptor, partial [Myxococcota bacterium]
DFEQLGAELILRVFPVDGLDLYANYSIHDTRPRTDENFGGRELDDRTSAHKVNLGAQYRSPFGLDVAVDLSWVSSQVWVEQILDPAAGGVRFADFELPSYTVLNARVGYRVPRTGLELAIVGQNLVDEGHREHPFGQPVQTRLSGWVTYRLR